MILQCAQPKVTNANTQTSTEHPVNQRKVIELHRALDEILTLAQRRGFFGLVGLELAVHDGIIQSVRRKFEQVEK
jgi:hypothetical protein